MVQLPHMAAGRPLKFPDVATLETCIELYFANTPELEWTITGLAIALDTSRETLMDYERGEGARAEFSDTVKRSKLKVEHAYEKRNIRRGNAGDIFALKQFGWTDKREVDHTSKGERITGFNFVPNATTPVTSTDVTTPGPTENGGTATDNTANA